MGHFRCNFLSYTFNRAVEIDVILPTMCGPEVAFSGSQYTGKDTDNYFANTHKVRAKYPLLYLLHGGINDYTTWERYTSIERYAEERRIAVVTFSGENKAFRNNSASDQPMGLLANRDNFYDFVKYELPDFLSANFPISTEPEHTYMAGLSMGGMGTMLHAFSRPEDFRAVGILSMSATRPVPGQEHPDGFLGKYAPRWDNGLLLQTAVREGKKLPAIYTACGTKDFGFERWKDFLIWMDELGVAYTSEYLEGYDHEWAFWDLEIVKFLDWIPRDDWYYLDKPKRRI